MSPAIGMPVLFFLLAARVLGELVSMPKQEREAGVLGTA